MTDSISITDARKNIPAKTVGRMTVTDKDGKASITISGLSKGTYDMRYQFRGTSMFYASSGTSKLYVQDPVCTFTASDLKMKYKDGSYFKATLKQRDKPLSNKTIKSVMINTSGASDVNANGQYDYYGAFSDGFSKTHGYFYNDATKAIMQKAMNQPLSRRLRRLFSCKSLISSSARAIAIRRSYSCCALSSISMSISCPQ